MLQELEKKKAQSTLTLSDVANALRFYHEMEDKLPPSPPRETRQLPDENGCFWACDWYSPDDISDEEWWCKERWYAYCEINSAPPDKTTAARGQGRTFQFGDRAIEPPVARPMLGFTLEGLPAVLEPPGVIGGAMAATGSRIQPIAMAGSGTFDVRV